MEVNVTENEMADVAAFFRANSGRLLQTALLMTGNREEAQDLLQETMERTLRAWGRRPIEFPGAYARTVMVRILQRQRARSRLFRPWPEHYEPQSPDTTNNSDVRSVLLAALSQLPPRRRAAVVLRHWEGYSESETAQVLNCSVGTVKSQTSRGLEQLRDLCGDAFPSTESALIQTSTTT